MHRTVALWLVKSARALTMPERDVGFRKVMERATGAAYAPPCYNTVKHASFPHEILSGLLGEVTY